MMLVHFCCSHLTQVWLWKTVHMTHDYPMKKSTVNRFRCFFCWTKSAVGDFWVSDRPVLFQPTSVVSWFVLFGHWLSARDLGLVLFCLDLGEVSQKFESDVLRIWKKVKRPDAEIQIIMYLPENFHLFGVFCITSSFWFGWFVVHPPLFTMKIPRVCGKMFTWIFQESVEMNFQIHNAWQVLGALCGWIKRKSGAEILLFIWR